MKRGISHLHAMVLFLAVALAAVSGCEQPESAPPAPLDDANDMSGTIEVEAGEVAGKLLGVETYRIYVDLSGAVLEVELLDAEQVERGTMSMVLGQEQELTRLELRTPEGSVASVTPHEIDHFDGQTTVVRRFESEGAIFRTISRVDASGQVVEIAYDAGGPPDEIGEGGIVVARDGTSEEPSAIQHWLDDNVASLEQNAAMNALYVVMVEPTWLLGVAELVESLELPGLQGEDIHEGNLGTSKQAIHKSPLCSGLIALLAVGGILAAVCTACGGSVAALGPSAGWSAIAAIPSCIWCAAGVGIGIIDMFACFYSYYFKAKTANDCVSECHSWDDASVAGDEHTCVCTCNAAKCDTACKQAHGNNYQGNNCLANKCECSEIPNTTASSSSSTASTSSTGVGGGSSSSSTSSTGGYGGSSSSSSTSSTSSTGGYGGSSSSSSTVSTGGYGGYGGSYTPSYAGAYGSN